MSNDPQSNDREIERRTFFGALVGLLAAPFAGKKTRKNLVPLERISATYSDSSYTVVGNVLTMPDWNVDCTRVRLPNASIQIQRT